MNVRLGLPDLGVGVGLRPAHYAELGRRAARGEGPGVDVFELLTENFLVEGGRPIANLERAISLAPSVPHGVSLSLGSADPLDRGFLAALRGFARRTRAPWLSDHLCWSGVGGAHAHELFPLPLTIEVARYVAERARVVQDALEVPLLLENVSSYASYRESTLGEDAFLVEVLERADVGLLLDVNNVYVSAKNHGFDPEAYLDALPLERVAQIHLAGHTEAEGYLLDTHSRPVADPVWALYERVVERTGPVTTILEWDDDLPSYAELLAEADRARARRDRALARHAAARPREREHRSAPATLVGPSEGPEPVPPAGLRRLQEDVQALCLAPAPLAEDETRAALARRLARGGPHLDGVAQLDIYRRQYWLRHEDALAEDHPGLSAVLGDEGFAALARSFFSAPPSARSLRDVGVGLAAALEALGGLPEGRRALAQEMLAFELCLVELFDAADVPPLPSALLELAPDALVDARLVPSPLALRLSLRHPVHAIRAAARAGGAPSLDPAATELVVHRREGSLVTESLRPEEARLLDALFEGRTIAEACARAAEGLSPEALAALGAGLAELVERWTRAGLFVALVSSPPGALR